MSDALPWERFVNSGTDYSRNISSHSSWSQPPSPGSLATELERLRHKCWERKRKRGLFNSQFLLCVHFFLLLRGKSSAILCLPLPPTLPYLILPQTLSYSQIHFCNPSTFSNINPNRLSTEGYCSSSQKRRQIFRYWGAADFDLCVAMPIFESGLVMIVVTCGGFSIFAWHSRLIDSYPSTAPWGFQWPMHGCFVVSLETDWPTYPFTHPPSTTYL